jgi:iron complex outermembrane receptor protein
LCDQFDRDSTDQRIDEVRASFINIASQTNTGYDIALRYTVDVDGGSFRFDTQHTFQDESQQSLFEDTVINTNGEFGDPKHVASYNMSFDKNDWSVNWNINYVGAVSNEARYLRENGTTTATYRGATIDLVLRSDSVLYHSFSYTRDWSDTGLSTVFGVANAFDEAPPRVSSINGGLLSTEGNSSFYSQYDWLGRRFFLNASYTF